MGQKKENSNSANKYLSLLALGFISCSALLIAISFESKNPETEGSADFSSLSPQKENQLINKHLLKTTEDIEYSKLKAQVENLKAVNSLSNSMPQKPVYTEENNFFDFSGDPRERQLAEDVGRANDVKPVNKNTPQSVIYESMIRDELSQKQDYEAKIAKAKEFIRKAREDGWAVVIDQNFRIKSYQRIDKSQQDEVAEKEARKFEGYDLFPTKQQR